jgi:uncharacterized protein (DUF4415 family)
MAARGGSRTDLARVRAMTDEDVERAVANDPGEAAAWRDRVEVVMPRRKVPVSIRLDAVVVERLRAFGSGWQTRVNAILRAYLDTEPRREDGPRQKRTGTAG